MYLSTTRGVKGSNLDTREILEVHSLKHITGVAVNVNSILLDSGFLKKNRLTQNKIEHK
jgi:hypothetical protein